MIAWCVLAAGVVVNLVVVAESRASGPAFAVLSGITTSTGIQSMACYGVCPGGGPHAHVNPNPIDLGAGTSTPAVWVQLDYLPANVDGGYAIAYRDTAGACGEKVSPYNGHRIKVDIFHYRAGSQINWHHESYLHVDPIAIVNVFYGSATWKHWNNSTATSPMWASWMEDFKFNNTTAGGYNVGSTHNVTQTDTACTDGNHVHQESDSDGSYAPGLYIYKAMTARFSDAHYVTLSGISGNAP